MGKLELVSLNRYKIQYLYHMTHIDNLASILEYGLLSHGNKFQKQDISNNEVNDRRSIKDPFYKRSKNRFGKKSKEKFGVKYH